MAQGLTSGGGFSVGIALGKVGLREIFLSSLLFGRANGRWVLLPGVGGGLVTLTLTAPRGRTGRLRAATGGLRSEVGPVIRGRRWPVSVIRGRPGSVSVIRGLPWPVLRDLPRLLARGGIGTLRRRGDRRGGGGIPSARRVNVSGSSTGSKTRCKGDNRTDGRRQREQVRKRGEPGLCPALPISMRDPQGDLPDDQEEFFA